jgi:LysM repeat protein
MGNNKSNFKYFLDFLSENVFAVLAIIFLVILSIRDCNQEAKAGCLTYTVQKGDTLNKISQQHFGDKSYWRDIKRQNHLKSNYLKIGQELSFYIPDDLDWTSSCKSILKQRQKALRLNRPEVPFHGIVDGVAGAGTILGIEDPILLLEMCRWAITTAEHESMYKFAIGSVGEIGIYQFRLDTARLTLRRYNISNEQDLTDEYLVRLLLDTKAAATVFNLHFHTLYSRYNSLWLAWYRYNGTGDHAKEYADKIMKRYYEIRMLQAVTCRP